MSKVMLAFLLFACVVIYDPPQVLGLLGPDARSFGWRLKSALDIERILPGFAKFGKR